jgi:hypothetical protein
VDNADDYLLGNGKMFNSGMPVRSWQWLAGIESGKIACTVVDIYPGSGRVSAVCLAASVAADVKVLGGRWWAGSL